MKGSAGGPGGRGSEGRAPFLRSHEDPRATTRTRHATESAKPDVSIGPAWGRNMTRQCWAPFRH